ncbi:MAG: serine/threonine protein kinase [Planctomycetota bacterium]|nr:serine/threonine protein kinase [Planctomycetota bacterium]
MNVVLRVTAGPHEGKSYVFERHATFVVGRSALVQFPVPDDKFLSRDHFLIEFNPPACYLKDMGSTNGTKLNGQKVDGARLKDGDLIEAGKSAFQIIVQDTWNEIPRIRCQACGCEPALEITVAVEPGDRIVNWFCDACRAHRRRYPTPPEDYWIERKLGGGGMGEVYKARKLKTKEIVAIKMMIPEAAAGDRARHYFRREMDVLRQLRHPNIVEFFEMVDESGQFQLIMEYVDGLNARQFAELFPEKRLPIPIAARIGVQLLAALEHAHEKGFVHRDIKPSNLLVTGPNDRPNIKLSDFGLAKSFRDDAGFSGLTHQGDIGGSSGFISPDHIRDFREVREPGDLYSVGATLYYLLTNRYPFLDFDPNKAAAYAMILEHPSVPLRVHRPDAPEGLDRLLRKSLEKQPRDRWKSAAAMGQALSRFLEATP